MKKARKTKAAKDTASQAGPTSDAAAPPPEARRGSSWLGLLLPLLVVLLACTAVRLTMLTTWWGPEYQVGGEPIQNTPDAYHWLAGTQGLGPAVDDPMTHLVRLGATLGGTSVDRAAYFLPLLLGALLPTAVFLWGRLLAGTAAGMAAGLLAGFFPAYYGRTQLGQLDTDFATTAFPLFVALLLATWSLRHLRVPWLSQSLWQTLRQRGQTQLSREEPLPSPQSHGFLFLLVAGLLCAFFQLWHNRVASYVELSLYLVLLSTLLAWKLPTRNGNLAALAILFLAASQNLPAMTVALLMALGLRLAPGLYRRLTARTWPVLGAALLALLVFVLQHESLALVLTIYLQKFVVGVTHAAVDEMLFPSITLATAEEMKSLPAYLQMLHANLLLMLLGYLGFALLLCRRPVVLYLLPLALLSLAGPLVGVRLAVYAAPVTALGLAVPLAWGLERLTRRLRGPLARRAVPWAGQALLVLVFLSPHLGDYLHLEPIPVLSAGHGTALQELSRVAPDKAWLWCNWTYGYAARYYARRNVLTDGGARRQSGLGLLTDTVYMTQDPALAAGLMRLTSAKRYQSANIWQAADPGDVQGFLARLAANPRQGPPPREAQYLVLSYDALGLVPHMFYFANWDFQTRGSRYPRFFVPEGGISVDPEQGLVHMQGPDGRQGTVAVESIDLLSAQAPRHADFPANRTGLHLLLNEEDRGGVYIMESAVYRSMLVQGLVQRTLPPTLDRYFEIAVDQYPLARILRLKE